MGPQLIQDYVNTQRTWLPFFERLLSRSAVDGPYVAGKHLTFADFLAFDMVDTNLRVDGQCLDNLPNLKALAIKVSEVEGGQGQMVLLQRSIILPTHQILNHSGTIRANCSWKGYYFITLDFAVLLIVFIVLLWRRLKF